jgi:hypothetical protein
MATTFTQIGSAQIVSTDATSVEFTNIPATFTDLKVEISARTDGAGNVEMIEFTYNNNTSNRTSLVMEGRPASDSVATFAPTTLFIGNVAAPGQASSSFSIASLYIPNYAGSGAKVSLSDAAMNGTNNERSGAINVQRWNDSTAITSIQFKLETGARKFVQHSTFYLYGIKNS